MRNTDGTVPIEGDGKSRFREAAHVVVSTPVLSNFRKGTLEVVVPAAPAERGDGHSPWEGMSGAALWVGDRIVGVIAAHHPGEGLARLAAVRLDLALDRLDPPAAPACVLCWSGCPSYRRRFRTCCPRPPARRR